MKIMSDDAVTRQDLVALDKKYSRQILRLKIYIAASTAVTVAVTIALHFIR